MKKIILDKVLKQLLDERNLTARQLSRDCDIPASTIAGMLSGRGFGNPQQQLRIANYFEITLEYLLFGIEIRQHLPVSEETLNEVVFDGLLDVTIKRVVPRNKT